jgi:hypothetical protein
MLSWRKMYIAKGSPESDPAAQIVLKGIEGEE